PVAVRRPDRVLFQAALHGEPRHHVAGDVGDPEERESGSGLVSLDGDAPTVIRETQTTERARRPSRSQGVAAPVNPLERLSDRISLIGEHAAVRDGEGRPSRAREKGKAFGHGSRRPREAQTLRIKRTDLERAAPDVEKRIWSRELESR